ncbi:hypothetical protein LEP1GSC061_2679 [Leptospira wolffii serovar Khorat str. Khorat-H2]|nr:hypothetical protein LEP1GSC061_2679 [Leptospira wolffii serovar Khorat str. Khorat-H2]
MIQPEKRGFPEKLPVFSRIFKEKPGNFLSLSVFPDEKVRIPATESNSSLRGQVPIRNIVKG